MAYQFYAFQHHRKAELIAKAKREYGLTRREANEMTLEELSHRVDEPYVALRMMPKPSHRRPLPVRRWVVPREFKVFIVMSKPYAATYGVWEQQAKGADSFEDEDAFYEKMEVLSNGSSKCPKVKWFQSFHAKEPDRKKIVLISPAKWNAVREKFASIPHAVLHPRGSRRSLHRFNEGVVNVLIIPSDDPPYDELPDCTWVHFRPDLSHRRYASEHYYLNVVKPEEKNRVNGNGNNERDEEDGQKEFLDSVDWWRWQRELESQA